MPEGKEDCDVSTDSSPCEAEERETSEMPSEASVTQIDPEHQRLLNLTDAEMQYEEEILRNPYVVKGWLRYAEFKRAAPPSHLNMIYERAVKQLPGSYKLWHAYLMLRKHQVRGCCVTDVSVYEEVSNTFERSLVFMFKMPNIWLMYLQCLMDQKRVTKCRHAFDRALRSLPVTQHGKIWKLYLKFIQQPGMPPESAMRVWRRYLKLNADDSEDFIDYLTGAGKLDEAAIRLAELVNREKFVSLKGKSKFQLWMQLCTLLSKHPFQVTSLDAEAIIRQGITRFTDQRGQLWNALADYYIRAGLLERARDIYMEAVHAVVRVRDFTQVFDAYVLFEESLVKHMLSRQSAGQLSPEQETELELMLTRYEHMIIKRPLYLNSVLLRQNPHNVPDWMNRIELLKERQPPVAPAKLVKTFQKALSSINAEQAVGKVSELYIKFAKFYLEHSHMEEARMVWEKAVEVLYKHVEELANIWCEYAEMEINKGFFERAMKLMQRATTPPPKKAAYWDSNEPPQQRVYRSLKIWCLYADLEESMGTFSTAKAVYEAIIDLRIATPQIIMNYALFLEENRYFEDSFKVYEKGVALFKWPHVSEVWSTYLAKFIGRYEGKKLERARDLFEQCLQDIPVEFAKSIYLLYAKMEQQYGMIRHAMTIYERGTVAVKPEEQMEMFEIYLKKAAEYFGVTHTRSIYEKAIDILPDEATKAMCLRFAELETKLGEVDRARAIFAHCSQICDPRVSAEFWSKWKEFEVRHGNEDTLREMLRIRRSVQATYNTKVNYMTQQMLDRSSNDGVTSEADPKKGLNPENATDSQAGKENILFVRSSANNPTLADQAPASNPNEMDLGSDSEDENLEESVEVVMRNVPSTVFGSLLEKGGSVETSK